MTSIRISADAERDLDAIWDYIAGDSPVNADKFLDQLITAITTTLRVAPLAGRTHDEFEIGLRSFPMENYVTFYRVRDTAVEIVRIIHSSRDLGSIFGN